MTKIVPHVHSTDNVASKVFPQASVLQTVESAVKLAPIRPQLQQGPSFARLYSGAKVICFMADIKSDPRSPHEVEAKYLKEPLKVSRKYLDFFR